MRITRANPLGGRPLGRGSFPLSEDRQGNFGLKLGYHDRCHYCQKGGGEPIVISLSDARDFASRFGVEVSVLNKELRKQGRLPWKRRVAMWLMGKREYYKVLNEGWEEER